VRAFSELQSYYLFAEKFGRPAKGNDKGKVEGLVGYVRRNFLVPIPRVNSWDELNAHLEVECRKRRERRLRGHQETIISAASCFTSGEETASCSFNLSINVLSPSSGAST
jgi:hypothetical protein